MSSFYKTTKHPLTGKWEKAMWIDDFYAQHHYGVEFPDKKVYDPEKIDLITK